jgi:hypothetical protein
LADLTKDLEAWGFCIALEKLQKMPPFQYLGQVINGWTFDPSPKSRDQEGQFKKLK